MPEGRIILKRYIKGCNPVLPIEYYIPDVEAHVYSDGRLYMFGSLDRGGEMSYCSKIHHVFSTDNMLDYRDHGKIIDADEQVSWSSGELYAPDCIEKNGRYYLYICTSDRKIGVAVADSPYGPYSDAIQIEAMSGIDPAVFVDDNGQAYIYWGQFDEVRAARLSDDMMSIDVTTMVQPLSVLEHAFHEGSSMRKRNGIYYYLFADTSRRDDRPTCLGYATSDSPLGPFKYQGIIIDNYNCDPHVWNNHGSIELFDEQWYVFYHRSTRASCYSRRVCVEKISFTEEGLIPEVLMTTQGVSGPIDPRTILPAYMSCALKGHIRIMTIKPGVEGLGMIHHGDSAGFRYLAMNSKMTKCHVILSAKQSGVISVLIAGQQKPIGKIYFDSTGGMDVFETFSCDISPVFGVHEIIYKFYSRDGKNFANIEEMYFS